VPISAAQGPPALAGGPFKDDEAPRLQLAVVGHPRRGLQKRFELRPVGHGQAERLGRPRAARQEEVEGLGSGRKRATTVAMGVGHDV
jgi:hypothetical protein